MSPLEVCRWLESTPGSVALHESIWVYPIVESVHVLTLCLFLGMAVMVDLRLLGASLTATPVSQVIRRLGPWMLAGFAVMVVSGALLFYAVPVKTYCNIFFRLKMTFLLMSGLNVAVFHLTTSRSMPRWDLEMQPPMRARLAGGVSLALWAAVAVCGRLLAYNWFDKDPAAEPMSILKLFTWFENSSVGEGIRDSRWLFPAIESLHLLGLAVIGGSVLAVNLSLLGLGLGRRSAARLWHDTWPWFMGSLTIMLGSGFLLFTSEAVKLYYHEAFWVKMSALLLSLVFTATVQRPTALADPERVTLLRSRAVGLVSLLLWFLVGAAGRWIGFS